MKRKMILGALICLTLFLAAGTVAAKKKITGPHVEGDQNIKIRNLLWEYTDAQETGPTTLRLTLTGVDNSGTIVKDLTPVARAEPIVFTVKGVEYYIEPDTNLADTDVYYGKIRRKKWVLYNGGDLYLGAKIRSLVETT
ncbi:MAG: hypothetical protein ABIH11_07550 [Candidatus Altiarchaeota archaeon]